MRSFGCTRYFNQKCHDYWSHQMLNQPTTGERWSRVGVLIVSGLKDAKASKHSIIANHYCVFNEIRQLYFCSKRCFQWNPVDYGQYNCQVYGIPQALILSGEQSVSNKTRLHLSTNTPIYIYLIIPRQQLQMKPNLQPNYNFWHKKI